MSFFHSSSDDKKPARKPASSRKASRRGSHHKARLGVEALEDRSLPSGATISGFVFNDLTNNGIMNAGDPPFANAAVELTQVRNGNTVVVNSTTTDANGFYQFTTDQTVNTSPHTLTQTITFPTTDTDFSLSNFLSQFNPNLGQLQSIQITNSGSITSDIAVENTSRTSSSRITATVAGSLTLTGVGGAINVATNLQQTAGTFNATTYDGSLNFSGNSGFDFGPQQASGSQSITLSGASINPFIGSGNVQLTETGTATSSAQGGGNLVMQIDSTGQATVTVTYTYIPTTAIQPGNYTILELTTPAGFVPGKISSNGVVLNNPPGDEEIPVTVTSGNFPNNDFAFLTTGSISGTVFVDANNNGLQDAIDPGLGGVTVTLTGTNYLGNSVTLTTTTGANGTYSFANLLPGMYTVTMTQPSNYFHGKDTAGSLGGTVGTDVISNVTIPPGAQGVNYNFAVIQPASLSGTVFVDANNNGLQDGVDPGLAGVSLTLTGTNYLGSAVTATTTTTANGTYTFVNVMPGTYTVTMTQPANYFNGKDSAGSLGGTVGTDVISNVIIPPGGQGLNYNFALIQPAGLSGTVFVDANDNGLQDGVDPGLAGVSLTLTGTNYLGSAVTATTTTTANGTYAFVNVMPGTYTVTMTKPANYFNGKDSAGSLGGTVGTNVISNVIIPPGGQGLNYNFALIQSASLSGTVFVDANDNGLQDGVDPGLAGVTLTLTGTNYLGNTVTATTTSGANGTYAFVNVMPGTYTVTMTQPANYLSGKDTAGNLGGTVGTNVIANVTIPPGAQGVNYNFALLQSSSLSGYVFIESTPAGINNGVFQAPEVGLGGVTVTLTGTNDLGAAVNIRQITNSGGFYSFANLRPGTYTITKTPVSAYLDGKTTVGSQGGQGATDVISQIVLAAKVQGVNNNFGELTRPISGGGGPPDGPPLLPPIIAPMPPDLKTPPVPYLGKGQALGSVSAEIADGRLINAYYNTILGRDATNAEVANWINFIFLQGGTLGGVVNSLWNGAEHRTDEIVGMYKAIFNTTAGPSQTCINAYLAQFNAGASTNSVLLSMMISTQAKQTYPNLSDYILMVYRVTQGTGPTAAQLTALLNSGMNRNQIGNTIMMQPVTLQLVISRVFTELLNRAPTSTEINQWTYNLQHGISFDQFATSIVKSSEFTNYVN